MLLKNVYNFEKVFDLYLNIFLFTISTMSTISPINLKSVFSEHDHLEMRYILGNICATT